MAAIEEMKKLPAASDESIDEMVRFIYDERHRGLPDPDD
jgi:hypothetical protein